jgi:transposase
LKLTSNKESTGEHQEIRVDELQAIISKAKGLSDSEHSTLSAAVETLGFITHALESKDVSIERLKRMLFGASTETSNAVLEGLFEPKKSDPSSSASGTTKSKVKGHGRNGADSYTGAVTIDVPHDIFKPGDACPSCPSGKLSPIKRPGTIVRVTGMAPLSATVYKLEKLRCNACGEVFTAREPPGVGPAKYDEGAVSMIALLKYAVGMPFHRLEKLQDGLGIPLPSSTQWDLVAQASESLLHAYQELVRQAAQGDVLHNDDTTMKILELTGKRRSDAIASGDIDPDQRVGIFTSGIVSIKDKVEIALFFTGNKHAGENLANVLALRASDLTTPIQMCDALSHNTCGEFDTIVSNCLVHARRQFVEVSANFPDECRFVIEAFREVYRTDAMARQENLRDEERLALHQKTSAPVMEKFKTWMDKQIVERLIEPNSGLGAAIKYTRKHWDKLTLFLRKAGAPLDNNTCERALKKTIVNRKNAYFYKTREGARIGDLYMSLIHTTERCGGNPFEYLVSLQKNAKAVAESPADWMPWNYLKALEGQ